MLCFLVLIETSGNQNYIFSTNKLKENVGASELTYRAGTAWVLEAVKQVRDVSKDNCHIGKNVNTSQQQDIDTEKLKNYLLDKNNQNPPIESSGSSVEVIIATSGKALLITKEEKAAKAIVRYVTHQATRYAPGLDIFGVIQEFCWGNGGIVEAIAKIYKKYETYRSQRPSPHLRFLRLPIVDECDTSDFPASYWDKKTIDNVPKPRSAFSYKKRQFNKAGLQRIRNLVKLVVLNSNTSFGFSRPPWKNSDIPESLPFITTLNFSRSIRMLNEEFSEEDLQIRKDSNSEPSESIKRLDWLAVVHADGNSVGNIFLNFQKYIQNIPSNASEPDRKYIDALRKFSLALDICTERAFINALDAFSNRRNDKLIPILPLVLGGDDLTVVCDGKSAIEFSRLFLQNFERETGSSQQDVGDIVPQVAQGASLGTHLTACAGIAIIKPHFPFSVAYELSESLTKSAKTAKNISKDPCSALDFHVLYDTSSIRLEGIRKKLEFSSNNTRDNKKTYLYARPYVVTSQEKLFQNNDGWIRLHHWDKFYEKIQAIKAKNPNSDRLQIPSSQIHDLRAGLFLGKEVANARYQLIKERYREQGITKLELDNGSLFADDWHWNGYITSLLDAIEAADFIL
jgi:hypothetical protein